MSASGTEMALEARIKALLALEENRKCVDCGSRSPRWASYSLGVFMCLQCAGVHRALGVHISRVKSADFDRWTEDQVRAMEAVGNARGREEYGPSYAEANSTTYPPDAHALESFIRSKYVRRLYARGGFGASFNPIEAAAATGAEWKPQLMQQTDEDLWSEYREPEIDTTSKIRIDWPRKPAVTAAAAAPPKAQKEPSLIDLFEPAPVVQQPVAAVAAPFNPFFADFATAPTVAAAADAADPFDMTAAVAAPSQLQQPQFAVFPPQQLQLKQQPQPSFDDDFGDFVAAAAAKNKTTAAAVQQLQSSSLFGDNSENVPPLPPKDYNPFASTELPPALPARDYGVPSGAPSSCSGVNSALAGLFSGANLDNLVPTAATQAPAASRISNADILALYGTRAGGGSAPLSPMVPTFAANFGGPGASWA
ncbi:hypothetical protein PENTCL1PPCAC_12400 [Pristionchus entomophagus]|uniref:Arf-GAP domain-containing protein n=1 Tax=Pristionchus entomophagus TaxID=358040 RepID=A0AAV5TCS9_9BILA|nr:hypothetical protein PENTCL1PPCAC_12400 [Pristionchus entomophagus]